MWVFPFAFFPSCPAVIIYWVGKVILGRQPPATLEITSLLKTAVIVVYLIKKKEKEKKSKKMEKYIFERMLKKYGKPQTSDWLTGCFHG